MVRRRGAASSALIALGEEGGQAGFPDGGHRVAVDQVLGDQEVEQRRPRRVGPQHRRSGVVRGPGGEGGSQGPFGHVFEAEHGGAVGVYAPSDSLDVSPVGGQSSG